MLLSNKCQYNHPLNWGSLPIQSYLSLLLLSSSSFVLFLSVFLLLVNILQLFYPPLRQKSFAQLEYYWSRQFSSYCSMYSLTFLSWIHFISCGRISCNIALKESILSIYFNPKFLFCSSDKISSIDFSLSLNLCSKKLLMLPLSFNWLYSWNSRSK